MAFHFRKSISICPGVRINLNKKSTSVSVGGKGFRQTFSSTGRHRTTVGLPGTGMYWSQTTGNRNGSAPTAETAQNSVPYVPPAKSKEVTMFLAIVGGLFGLHRFYVGKKGTGILWMCTCGMMFIGYIADIIAIKNNKFTDKYGRRIGTDDVCVIV